MRLLLEGPRGFSQSGSSLFVDVGIMRLLWEPADEGLCPADFPDCSADPWALSAHVILCPVVRMDVPFLRHGFAGAFVPMKDFLIREFGEWPPSRSPVVLLRTGVPGVGCTSESSAKCGFPSFAFWFAAAARFCLPLPRPARVPVARVAFSGDRTMLQLSAGL